MFTWRATSPWLKRIAAAATIAGAACALTVQPASADEHWQRYHRDHHRHHYPRDVRPIYPPAVHYYNPPVVYPAYPVYRAPPPVYAPPPGLSIVIPFR